MGLSQLSESELVQPTGRGASGYREYPVETVRIVRFIKRAQGLGFTLGDVEELVRLRGRAWSGNAPWQLREAAVAKVADIDRRMRELGALKRALAELVAACDATCRSTGLNEPAHSHVCSSMHSTQTMRRT